MYPQLRVPVILSDPYQEFRDRRTRILATSRFLIFFFEHHSMIEALEASIKGPKSSVVELFVAFILDYYHGRVIVIGLF